MITWLFILSLMFQLPISTDISRFGRQQGETLVNVPSSISGATFSQILQEAGSPLAEHASRIYAHCEAGGVDCAFMLAIWRKDSSYGKAGASVRNRNPGNIVCRAARRHTGCDTSPQSHDWAMYGDWGTAALDAIDYIKRTYFEGAGETTVEAIIANGRAPDYAPDGDCEGGICNRAGEYVRQVLQWMQEWGSGNIETAPGGSYGGPVAGEAALYQGGGMWDDYLIRPIDNAFIETYRSMASGWWEWWSGVLRFVMMLTRLRSLVIEEGIRPLVDWLTADLLGVTVAALTFGWLLGMFGLIVAQFFARLEIVSVKRVLVGAALVPLLLPWSGNALQAVDTFRANLGSEIEEGAFTRSGGLLDQMLGGGTVAPSDLIGTVGSFDPAMGDARHGDAVLGAYLFATIDDVTKPEADLPKGFIEVYFPQDTDLAVAEAPEREEAKRLAWLGVRRMVSAIPPAGFAIVEALIQLFWSLSLGFLVLAMVLAAPFFWLEPVLVFLYSLARQTLYLLFSSVGLSFFVGLINAFVFGSLSKGSAGAVMITAGLGGVMLLVFGWYALKSVGQAFVAISGAVTAGRLSAQEHLQGWTTAKHVAQAPGQATAATVQGAGKATDAAGDTYKKVLERKLAFDTARPGTSSHYAAAYALGDVPALAHVGALARSMGYQMPDEIRRGLYARQTAGRQDPRSERAVRAIDRDAKVIGGTP